MIPQGYKQTEIGVIPEEWEIRPLLGAVRIANGQVDPRDEPFSSMILVAPDHIESETGRLLGKQTAAEQRAISGKYLFSSGDVVYSKIRPYLRKAFLADFDGLCSADMYPLKPSADVLGGFILSILLGHRFSMYAESVSVRSGMPKINRAELADFSIALPTTHEQRAIAEALGDVDALLGALDRLIAKKRDLKQAAMQQLLTGQTRLPGFTGEWEVKSLKSIVQTPVTDGPHLTPRFLDDGVPFLSVNNLIDNKVDLRDLRFVSKADHQLFSRKCKPQKNDILLGKAASVGKVALVELDLEFNIWSPIALIRVGADNAPRFVFYQLQSADLVQQIALLTNSSSQGNIGMGDIERLTLHVPSLPEQTAIAEVLVGMDVELGALEKRRDKTRAIKQAMMQELLTGRTRLI